MPGIKVIDGYHSIYPLNYKIKFRKIIEKELENNNSLKKYYDNWGSRVYAFYTDKNNILLNFQYAKMLGADYVISKFPKERIVVTNDHLMKLAQISDLLVSQNESASILDGLIFKIHSIILTILFINI